jgi:hypothetical protein
MAKALKGVELLYNLILKDIIKNSGQASGIMSIGDSVRKLADNRLNSYLVSAFNKGIDLNKFSESQLKYMLEMNKPYNRAKMALRKEDAIKSADVLDMKGRKLDKDKPIIGGTQDDLDKKADGGRAGFKEGLLTVSGVNPTFDMEKKMQEIREAFYALPARTQKRIGFKKFSEIYAQENFSSGGRAGFKIGRRAFLKLMGGVGAGIGALKSGILKLAGKEAAPQVAKEVVEQTTRSTPPPYFFELANKIKSLGKPDKVTYADRVEIHRYTGKNGNEYELVEDLSTGDMKITKDKPGMASSGEKTYDVINDRSVMEYKKGDVNVDPDKKIASKVPDEYDEYKIQFDVDGTEAEADDMSEFIRKEIIEETTSEAPKIKKAGGGIAGMVNKRFDFDSGGSPLQRLRQSLVDDLMAKVPGIPEEDLQIIVKDINLDMSPEEAQASVKANFLQLYGKAQGGLAGMLGE